MRSMTGYGKGKDACDGRELTIEIKSVNHRFLDISLHCARRCVFLEDQIRAQIGQALKRGHADVTVSYQNTRNDARMVTVDSDLALRYQEALDVLARALNRPNDVPLSYFASIENVLTETENDEDQDALRALCTKAMQEALQGICRMRQREGESLRADLAFHLDALEKLVEQIEVYAPQVPELYRDRLLKRLAEMQIKDVEPQRIAQEVALFADKCAIDEELSRLHSHISQMRRLFDAEGETGKKLDFLTQEMNREVNTIGSKASDVRITDCVVAAKNEIEKLREQVQNIE